MWGESSKRCELNCECAGLITDSFKINSGNSATKRKQEDSFSSNYKLKMNPHSINFNQTPSPIDTPKRRILGELQNITLNSPLFRPKISPSMERLKSSPIIDRNSHSPVSSRSLNRSNNKISRIFEERSKFKMNKENESMISETFVKLDMEEETRDCSFGESFQSTKPNNWPMMTKLDFTDALPSKPVNETKEDIYVPEKVELDPDFESLHDLEEEFDNENFDECTKYEIISTDSPNIISRGRASSSRKVNSRNFVFGAPIGEEEQSTSFNKHSATATRMLNFEDESFEFTSPAAKKQAISVSVKKSLKFTGTPTKNPLRHERSDSSIGSMSSMSCSPASTRLRIFASESTTSMESGFISELEEPFLEMDEVSNSPKVANFNDLLSGPIKENIITDKNFVKRTQIQRSLSLNPDSGKARVSLLSILEDPSKKRSQKRVERTDDEEMANKRRKAEELEAPRPVLHRALSENNASIMTALARSASEPDLIGDFSQPFLLPAARGAHSDLRAVTAHSLAALLRGDYRGVAYQVIDCRYPYEFEGGHIAGAVNLYTPEQVQALMNRPRPVANPGQREILIFHCEFSLERGPKLSRFLRSTDRAKNKDHYPSLNYPEIYLLHEGYCSFYQNYPELCSPAGYTAMLDPNHKESLKRHRSVSQQSQNSSNKRHRLLL